MNDIMHYRRLFRESTRPARTHRFYAENCDDPREVIRHVNKHNAIRNEQKAHLWAMWNAILVEAANRRKAIQMLDEVREGTR